MPAKSEMGARELKLVQWLNEAHVKESELVADLTAHIALTQKESYKKRLRSHLTETREHKRRVAQRIRQLGGQAEAPSAPIVPGAIGEVAGKAIAAVKGQVGMARAAVTEQAETHMRNAQEELREEHVEIAIYTRIETLAAEVGDRETEQLVRAIRRDEERMAKFLAAELQRLVKDVVRAEIPREQRVSTRRRASAAGSRSRSRSTASATAGSRSSGRSRSSTAAAPAGSARGTSAERRAARTGS
jgi:ferritin-like metal-binding protein YciE